MNNQEWEKLRKKARKIARGQYTAEASSIIRLTKEEITSIIDEANVDQEKLSELISIVDDTSKSNNQKAEIIKKSTELVRAAAAIIRTFLR